MCTTNLVSAELACKCYGQQNTRCSFALNCGANCLTAATQLWRRRGSSFSQAASAAAREQTTLGDSSFTQATSTAVLRAKNLGGSSFSQATSTAAFRAVGLVVQRLTRLWTEGVAGAELEVGLGVNLSCLGD